MASVGPNGPSSAVDNATIGDIAWTDLDYVLTDDSDFTGALVGSGNHISHYLVVTGFGFSIPTATIDGIKVEIKKRGSRDGGGYVTDEEVKLFIGDVITGSNYADTSTLWPSAVPSWATYGGDADKWGLIPTVGQVNSTAFGVAISADILENYKGSQIAYLYYVRITVYYTEGGAPPAVVTAVRKLRALLGVGR